jgi:hypothetical protein
MKTFLRCEASRERNIFKKERNEPLRGKPFLFTLSDMGDFLSSYFSAVGGKKGPTRPDSPKVPGGPLVVFSN